VSDDRCEENEECRIFLDSVRKPNCVRISRKAFCSLHLEDAPFRACRLTLSWLPVLCRAEGERCERSSRQPHRYFEKPFAMRYGWRSGCAFRCNCHTGPIAVRAVQLRWKWGSAAGLVYPALPLRKYGLDFHGWHDAYVEGGIELLLLRQVEVSLPSVLAICSYCDRRI